MSENKECKYYVFDNEDNKFIEDDCGLAMVGEKFVKEINEEINIRYLTFIKKKDYEEFSKSRNLCRKVGEP